jgi:hypothetical protein
MSDTAQDPAMYLQSLNAALQWWVTRGIALLNRADPLPQEEWHELYQGALPIKNLAEHEPRRTNGWYHIWRRVLRRGISDLGHHLNAHPPSTETAAQESSCIAANDLIENGILWNTPTSHWWRGMKPYVLPIEKHWFFGLHTNLQPMLLHKDLSELIVLFVEKVLRAYIATDCRFARAVFENKAEVAISNWWVHWKRGMETLAYRRFPDDTLAAEEWVRQKIAEFRQENSC